MDKTILTSVIVALVCIVLGYFVYPMVNKPVPIVISDVIYQDSGAPDSVWEQKVYDLLALNDRLKKENFRISKIKPVIVHDTLKTESQAPDEVYTIKDLDKEAFTSEKAFAWDSENKKVNPDSAEFIIKSKIRAYGQLPVERFDNDIVVRWQKYYEIKIMPQVEDQVKRAGIQSKFKGIIIGAMAIGGIATNNDYYSIGGLVAATGLYLLW